MMPARAMAPSHLEDDAALLAAARAGSEAAFELLVRRHHSMLVRVARALVRRPELAEELAQDCWLLALERLDTFQGKGTVRGWLATIVANRARTAAERESIVRLSVAEELDAGGPAVPASRFDEFGSWERPPRRWEEDTPERLVALARARVALESAIAALPPMQRAVVTLRDLEGLSAEEACRALELTDGNQRVLLHRGRSALRAVLEGFADGL